MKHEDEKRRRLLRLGLKTGAAVLLAPPILSLTACGGGGGDADSGGGQEPSTGGNNSGNSEGSNNGNTTNPAASCETKTFTFNTPGSHTHTVPSGCTVVKIEVRGGGGGDGGGRISSPGKHGRGGNRNQLNAYNVSSGQVFEALVGEGGNAGRPLAGGSGGSSPHNAGKNGMVGVDGITWSGGGGGGGGSTAVRLNGSVILRAGGGNGGAGANGTAGNPGAGGQGGSGGGTPSVSTIGPNSSADDGHNGWVRFIYG